MTQPARNLTDAESGFLSTTRYLIHDRAPLFTTEFAKRLEVCGVRPVKRPARSTNLNPYAERFVRSIKSECLAQIIPHGGAASSISPNARGNPRNAVGIP